MSKWLKWLLIVLVVIGILIPTKSANSIDIGDIIKEGAKFIKRPKQKLSIEAMVGMHASSEIEDHYDVSNDPALNARAQRIIDRLTPAANKDRKGLKYTIKVLNSQNVNAYAVPGGYIYFTSALLQIPGISDNELVWVGGHELGHTNKKHGLKQLEIALGSNIIIEKLSGTSKTKLWASLGAQLFLAGRSRDAEREADKLGFKYAVASGADSSGGLTMMRRFETLSKKNQSPYEQLFNTHPPSSERSQTLKSMMVKQAYGTDFKAVAGTNDTLYAASFRFPLDNYKISGYHFEPPQWVEGWGYHLGEDCKDSTRANVVDTPVYAPADGIVKEAKEHTRYGIVIIIEHKLPPGDPYGEFVCTVNAHCYKPQVQSGFVQKGQLIGYLADWEHNGNWAPHDHFGIRKGQYSTELDPDGKWRYRGYAMDMELRNNWIEPTKFIQDHSRSQPPTKFQRITIELLKGPMYLGDDSHSQKTVWFTKFTLKRENLEGATHAWVGLQVKGTPRKDPIISFNQREVGRAVTNTGRWETFSYEFSPNILRVGDNLIDLETFIPNMWQSYDDCEVKSVRLTLN